MISPFTQHPNSKPNINMLFVHKREHLEAYQTNFYTTKPSEYRNYSLKEILALVDDFEELRKQVSDIRQILNHINNSALINKPLFENEINRIYKLTESIIQDLNSIIDQFCEGKKSHRMFKKIEPNVLLLRRLISNVVNRLDSIIEQEIAFD